MLLSTARVLAKFAEFIEDPLDTLKESKSVLEDRHAHWPFDEFQQEEYRQTIMVLNAAISDLLSKEKAPGSKSPGA